MKSTAYLKWRTLPYGYGATSRNLPPKPTGPDSLITSESPATLPTPFGTAIWRRPDTFTLPSVSWTYSPPTAAAMTDSKDEVEYYFRTPVGSLWQRSHGNFPLIRARVVRTSGDKVHVLYTGSLGFSSSLIELDILTFICGYERICSQ